MAPPDLAPGQREVAILVDAETGVAGKIGPDSLVDIVATYAGNDQARHRAEVDASSSRRARIIEVGQPSSRAATACSEQRRRPEPGRAGHVRAHARSRSSRSPTRRPSPQRGPPGAAAARRRVELLEKGETTYVRARAAMSPAPPPARDRRRRRRLERGGAGAGGRGARGRRPRRRTRRRSRARCAGSSSTSSCCTTRSAAVPVIELAREHRGQLPRGRPGADRRRRLARPAARRDAGGPARRRLAAAVARAARGQRARRRPVVARAARARGGRGVGRRRARRPADRGRGRQGRRRHDDGGAPARARRGARGARAAGLRRRLRPPEGRLPRASWTCRYRRSVVDLVEVADEISVRHLQETLYTHKDGFRVLLAPDEGERAEEVDAAVARSVLTAVKARHALTVVDLGASVSEASAIGAEIANRVLVVTTPDVVSLRGVQAPARALEAAAGARGRRGRLRRAQPRLAQARDPARPRAQGGRRAAGATRRSPPTSPRFEAAVNTGAPARMEDAQAARELRRAARRARRAARRGDEPERRPRRAARPARPPRRRARPGTAEMMGLLPVLALVRARALAGRADGLHVRAGRPRGARGRARAGRRHATNTKTKKPYQDAAEEDLPKAWRKDAKIEIDKTGSGDRQREAERAARAPRAQQRRGRSPSARHLGRGRGAAAARRRRTTRCEPRAAPPTSAARRGRVHGHDGLAAAGRR